MSHMVQDHGFWLIDLTGWQWLGPVVRWVPNMMRWRRLDGGSSGRTFLWLDRFGRISSETWVASGHSVEAWTPPREPDAVVDGPSALPNTAKPEGEI